MDIDESNLNAVPVFDSCDDGKSKFLPLLAFCLAAACVSTPIGLWAWGSSWELHNWISHYFGAVIGVWFYLLALRIYHGSWGL